MANKQQPLGEFDVQPDPHDDMDEVPAMPGKSSKPRPPKHVTDDYQTRDHLETLAKAHAIVSDPRKMGNVQKLVNFHKKAMRSTKDLRNYNQDNYGGPGGGPKKTTDQSDNEEY